MKTILLLRHAKAEPPVPGQKDFDRPLAPRGREDAARMGRAIAKLDVVPDAVVASPAARAKETAELAAAAMKFAKAIRFDRTLYDAPGKAWIASIRALPAGAASVLVVAHSPGIEEAAGLLCGAPAAAFGVPTGGLLAFACDAERWGDLAAAGALLWSVRPKIVRAL